ncbi:class IIb bacteriocin, lactobin A/cerein 7B family [Arsukibacterium sp.]
MQELTFEQVEEVNGGVVWFIAAVVVIDAALIGAMVGMQQEMAK